MTPQPKGAAEALEANKAFERILDCLDETGYAGRCRDDLIVIQRALTRLSELEPIIQELVEARKLATGGQWLEGEGYIHTRDKKLAMVPVQANAAFIALAALKAQQSVSNCLKREYGFVTADHEYDTTQQSAEIIENIQQEVVPYMSDCEDDEAQQSVEPKGCMWPDCEKPDEHSASLTRLSELEPIIQELVEVLELSEKCMNRMSEKAYAVGMEGTKDWDNIAGSADLYGTLDKLRPSSPPPTALRR